MKIKECINGKIIERELSNEEIIDMEKEQLQAEREYWLNTPYDEAVNVEIRKKYTESQEFAILRQKDEKPEEYTIYYEYCEQCKKYVKEQFIRNNNI